MTFPELLKDLKSNTRQIHLAQKLGISEQLVSMLMTGHRTPSIDVIKRLLWVFPRRRDDILGVIFPERQQ